jgi:hypothetical protein
VGRKTSENPRPADPPENLVAALRRIFRPLARLLIARSLPFPLVSNLLRAAYVDVAAGEFPVEGKRQTDSRITLLTGVHRKDVKRLRLERHRTLAPPRAVSLGSQLIGRWLGLAEYHDEHGAPRPLPRLASTTDAPSFESLVRSVNTDIRPRVVLDEWLRLGIAEIDEQDRVVLKTQAFVPRRGADEMAYYFGRNLHDHLAASVHNVLGEADPFLERSVNYGKLTPDAVRELTELAQRRGSELLQELNARALQLQQRDAGAPQATQRFNFGVYLFSEEPAVDSDEPSSDSPRSR